MPRKYTEAQARAEKKYRQAHGSIRITVQKEQKQLYQEYANQKGISLTQLIINLIETEIKKNKGKEINEQ